MILKFCRRLIHRPVLCRTLISDVVKSDEKKRVIFSGIQPTGIPHLGNYLGALKKWVELQKEPGEIYYGVVDLHALTVPQEENMQKTVLDMTACLLACGVDTNRSILFQQSDVNEHAMLAWVFGCLSQVNTLKHNIQWKEKSKTARNKGNVGLFTYSVLQSADILLYKATHVPSGGDQEQNLELCREIARTFNSRYGAYFQVPQQICDPHSTRIKSLRDPFSKMSKSDQNEQSKICLTDSDDQIWNKIKKAVTDTTSEVTYDPVRRPGVANLIQIHSSITGIPVPEICNRAQTENLDTGQYKMAVGDSVIEHIQPIRTEYEKLLTDPQHLKSVLKEGGRKAKAVAEKNWNDIRALIGIT